MLQPPSSLAPADFGPFDGIPGLAAVARDEQMRLLWCTPTFAKIFGATPEGLLGTGLEVTLPPTAIPERTRMLQETIRTAKVQEFAIVGRGLTAITRVFPLRKETFGKPGIMLVLSRVPGDYEHPPEQHAMHAELGDLLGCSRRELEVLYWLCQGYDSPQIAEQLHRSLHTVHDHVKSLHNKLDVKTRGELVAKAVSRGILAFSPQQWERIVANAKHEPVEPREPPDSAQPAEPAKGPTDGVTSAESGTSTSHAHGPREAESGYATSPAPGTMSPSAFACLDGLPGMCAVARDAEMRLLWCNDEYARLNNRPPGRMLGTTLRDILPEALAKEREDIMRRSLREHVVTEYYQAWLGARWITRVWPLDPGAFGKPGLFVMIYRVMEDHDAKRPTLQLADLGELAALSKRELEVLYLLAQGKEAPAIAKELFRSVHTVQDHIKSIHSKLNMNNRAEVVRLAASKGILGFTKQQWDAIVAMSPRPREGESDGE